MVEDGIDGDAGVAHEGIAQVAEFPAGLGVDDEDFEGLFADGEAEGLFVVFLEGLLGFDGQADFEFAISFLLRGEHDHFLRLAHGREGDGLDADDGSGG